MEVVTSIINSLPRIDIPSHQIPRKGYVLVYPGTLGFYVGTECFADENSIVLEPGFYAKFGPSFYTGGIAYDLLVGEKTYEHYLNGSHPEPKYYLVTQTTILGYITDPKGGSQTEVY